MCPSFNTPYFYQYEVIAKFIYTCKITTISEYNMRKGTIITLNWLGIISIVILFLLLMVLFIELHVPTNPVSGIIFYGCFIFALIVFIMNIRFVSKMKQ